MTSNKSPREGWTVRTNGDPNDPSRDTITVIRHDPPQIRLQIVAPGIRSAGVKQKELGQKAIQSALIALREALLRPH